MFDVNTVLLDTFVNLLDYQIAADKRGSLMLIGQWGLGTWKRCKGRTKRSLAKRGKDEGTKHKQPLV